MDLGDKVVVVCHKCGGHTEAVAFEWGWSCRIVCSQCKEPIKVENFLEEKDGVQDDSIG